MIKDLLAQWVMGSKGSETLLQADLEFARSITCCLDVL